MRVLLDTHAFLWFILDNPKLTALARAIIIDPTNEVLLSPASYWELAIKIALGKYALPGAYESFLNQQIAINQIQLLHIEVRHTGMLVTMPVHHKDPFDRLLVSQALTEGIPLVSGDPALDTYGVQRLW